MAIKIRIHETSFRLNRRGPVRRNRSALCFFVIFVLAICLSAEETPAQDLPPAVEFNPRSYICYRTSEAPVIDGKPDEADWQRAQWTDYFVDIEGEAKPAPRYRTRVKMLWDDRYFYIAAEMEEPHVWATFTERDAVIFHENNFEVFIDPDGDTHHYYELEINALGTYWDLMLTKPYRDGGRAIDAWDIRGLKTGIDISGTLNDPADIDSGWTVELALPWSVLEEAAPGGRIPEDGDLWRVNFSRVEWQLGTESGTYVKESDTEDNWVWSPQGIVNMHYPEMWGYVRFSGQPAGSERGQMDVSPTWHTDEQIKWYLRQLYYRQHAYRKKTGTFTDEAEHLKVQELRQGMLPDIDPEQWNGPEIRATDHTFEISIRRSADDGHWIIREDGAVLKF